MNHPGKRIQGHPESTPQEPNAKPSQAEGEREEAQPGEENSVANPHVEAETPPKPSQAEGES